MAPATHAVVALGITSLLGCSAAAVEPAAEASPAVAVAFVEGPEATPFDGDLCAALWGAPSRLLAARCSEDDRARKEVYALMTVADHRIGACRSWRDAQPRSPALSQSAVTRCERALAASWKEPLVGELRGIEGCGAVPAGPPAVSELDAPGASLRGFTRAAETAWDLGVAAPRVRVGRAEVSLAFAPELARRRALSRVDAIDECYRAELTRRPGLGGLFAVRYVIGRDGAVQSVSTDASRPDEALARCVTRPAYALDFPQPEGGVVTVVQDVLLAPSAAEEPAEAPVAAKGSTRCSAARPCGAGLFCDAPSFRCETGTLAPERCTTEPAVCRPRRTAGEACAFHFECRGLCTKNVCTSVCGSG